MNTVSVKWDRVERTAESMLEANVKIWLRANQIRYGYRRGANVTINMVQAHMSQVPTPTLKNLTNFGYQSQIDAIIRCGAKHELVSRGQA